MAYDKNSERAPKTSFAFHAAAWTMLVVGAGCYLIGLWNATMLLNEKGYYFAVLVLGLFSALSLQKTVRDRMEGIRTTSAYTGACWTSFAISIGLLVVGLWNAALSLSEKGFYGIAFLMGLFSVIVVQKNVRDADWEKERSPTAEPVSKGSSIDFLK